MDRVQITQDAEWVVFDPEELQKEIDRLKVENEQLHSVMTRLIWRNRKLQADNANLRATVTRLMPDNPDSKPRKSTARFDDVFEGPIGSRAVQELIDNAIPLGVMSCCHPYRGATLTGGN